MKIKLRLLLLFTLVFLKTGYAQNEQENVDQANVLPSSFLDRTEFKIGYSGNIFWSNGLNLGAEYVWKEYQKTKSTNRGLRTNTHQFLFNGNLGATTNFSSRTDTGIYTNFGISWRRTNKKGKQFSIEFNPLGYYRSFLPETYEVNGSDVDKVFLPGRGYYSPSLSIGIGKQRKDKIRSGSYFNINFRLRTPYNTGTLPSFSLQYGYRFNFKKKR